MGEDRTTTGSSEERPSGDVPNDSSSAKLPRRRTRVGRWLRWSAAGLVILSVAALAVLSQTRRGQQLVLDELLDRVNGALAGKLAVGGIRSRTLLTGLVLTEVRLDAQGGRRLLEADSVVVRYSPLTLLFGSPRIRSTTVHGLDLEVSKYPGDDYANIDRIFAASPAGDSLRSSRPRTIELGRIGVRRGHIQVLTPSEGPEGPLSVRAPGGGLMRRMTFEAVDFDLEGTVVRPSGAVVLDARLASLTASAFLLERPLVIHEARGDLTFGALGIQLENAAVRLPGSLLEGHLKYGPDRSGDPWTFAAELRSDGWGDLADVHWIDSRIPSGRFSGGFQVRVVDGMEVELRDFGVQLEASNLSASGRAYIRDRLELRGLTVTVSPLVLSRLDPWLGRDLPLDGFVSGRVTFGGTLEDLQATGRLTLVPTGMGGASTTADFTGTLHFGDNPGATALVARFDPLNYRLLEALWPGASALGGGAGRLELNGGADQGLLVVADFSHSFDGASASRVTARGLVRRLAPGDWVSDVRGELGPLSLPLLDRVWPDLELRGSVSGPVRLEGRLNDLHVTGDLVAGTGRLAVDGKVNLTSLGSAYRLEADADGLPLSDLTGRLPAPSVLTGAVALEGAGLTLDSLDGTAEIALGPSRVGRVRIDSVTAALRAVDGVLAVDSIDADASGVHIVGGGSLGMTADAAGEASLDFTIESLLGLRPVLMGDSILVRDGLNPLEQDLLRARGIEPDTLPTELDVRMAGSVQGTADFRGRFGDMDADLRFVMNDVAYKHDEVDSARVSMSAGGLPATLGDWEVDLGARGVTWGARQFEQIHLGGTMSQRRGEGTADIQRRRNERYFLTGSFALDSVGGEVDVTDASVQINNLTWVLGGPTRIAWDDASVSVDSFAISRVGEDPMQLTAGGTLTRGGDSDFRLDMEGFHIEQALQIAQREDLDMAGHVDLSLTVLGPSERPVINALFQVEDPRYGAMRLSRLSGSLQYEDRSSNLRIDAWDGTRRALTAVGTLPLDLALTEVGERTSGEPMDIHVTADSLDARIALAYLTTLEDVVGTVSADVQIGGTSRDPEPSGTVHLADAAWTIEALGVRHTGVTGDLVLRPDRTIEVSLSTSRAGASTVSGVVTMVPLSDPTLDLRVTFDHFQTVSRRDMESTISGEFTLQGTYRLPVAEGNLTVDEATLFVEEFARAAGVVDLSDPTLFADGFAVDTTVFVAQPVLAGLRNPFLDNLRVAIDMSAPRNMWLRSNDMNVEMGGELLVRYDRRQGDLVLVGDLQALRGSYLVLGRTFEVDEGTVSFLGQPGVNPTLAIQASSRIRRRGSDPLEVQATVEGTLVQPLVSLSTEEAGLSQSDLISYLVFGLPSGELGRGATGTAAGVGQELGTGGLTYVTGALANQIGAALGQEIGLDYLSISQAGARDRNVQGNVAANVARNFAQSAQVEAGWYLSDDVFVVLVFSRPVDGTSSDEESGSFTLRGVRVELALTDDISVEGFVEDRFLRSGTAGLGASGLQGAQIVGAFVFGEWGYGGSQQ